MARAETADPISGDLSNSCYLTFTYFALTQGPEHWTQQLVPDV